MINQLPSKHFRLATLGRLALLDAQGNAEPSLGRRPRKLALLAVLAIEGRPMSRDQLAELFWGDRADARAKHSLSDAVSHLRQVLGVPAVEATRSTVALTKDAPLIVDVQTLTAAAERGHHESVLAQYAAPFLDAVHVQASPSFEQWADRRRSDYERLFLRSCQVLLDDVSREGNPAEVLRVAERWLAVEPASERAALAMMRAHAGVGREGVIRAVKAYGQLERRLREDLDISPAESVIALGRELNETRGASGASALIIAAQPTLAIAEESPRPRRWSAARLSGIAAATAVMAILLASFNRATSDGGSSVVVVPFATPSAAGADSAAQWIGDGAARLLASKLSRADVDAVVWKPQGPDTVALARRIAARWLVTGAVVRHDSLSALEVTVRRGSDGVMARRFTVAEANLISAADAAGVQVLASLSWQDRGPALSGIETHSVEAYRHYVLALRSASEGNGAVRLRHLDAAVGLDSGFMSAVSERLRHARTNGESEVASRLIPLFERFAQRLGEWDRLEMQLHLAQATSRLSDAEATARELMRRFPRDPRAYNLAMLVFGGHGKWHAADSILRAAAGLDSTTGHTLCDPCVDYGWWVEYRLMNGDHAVAESLARQHLRRYPDRHASWYLIARTLARSGKYDEALVSARRARILALPSIDIDVDIARMLAANRQLAAADSVVSSIGRVTGALARARHLELRMMVERERGQHERAARTAAILAGHPGFAWATLIGANSVSRLGRHDEAGAMYERVGSHPAQWGLETTPAFVHSVGNASRSFAWHHALLAEAIGDRCDVRRLRAIADSIETIGRSSNYSRDWTLHHHVRGIVHTCEGRDADAAAAFERARYTPYLGWTATNVRSARAQLRLGRPAVAIAALRPAYSSLPEGMGWYVPRAELDLEMSRAFRALGMSDSAAVYERYVKAAWADAEQGSQRRLAKLQ